MKIVRRAGAAAAANLIETAWSIVVSIEIGATWTAALLWQSRASLREGTQ